MHTPAARDQLLAYMNEHRAHNGSPVTHLGMTPTAGRYYISDDDYPGFIQLYSDMLDTDGDANVCIIERHRNCGPVVIDLDCNFKILSESHASTYRIFNNEFIEQFVRVLADAIKMLVMIDDKQDSSLTYVLQKPGALPYNSETANYKDGLHVILSNVVTEPNVQYLLRETILPQLQRIVDSLPEFVQVVTPVKDIYDKSVIAQNGWMMHGSHKEGKPAYQILQLWNFQNYPTIKKFTKHEMHNYSSDYQSVRNFSVRRHNIGDANELTETCKTDLARLSKENESRVKSQVNKVGTPFNYCEDIEHVKGLVEMLQPDRAANRESWIRVGWCCFNIDGRLLDVWIEFSKKSERHSETEAVSACQEAWASMKPQNLGIASLIMWAKEDTGNSQQFKDYMSQSVESAVIECCEKYLYVQCTEQADGKLKKSEKFASWSSMVFYVVRIMNKLWRHVIVCSSPSSNIWWEFKNHRWSECELGLKKYCNDEAYMFFSRMAQKFTRDKMLLAEQMQSEPSRAEELQVKKERYERLGRASRRLADNMRNVDYKMKLAKEANEIFYWQNTNSREKKYSDSFESTLDSERHIIGLDNGVYDLQLMQFREGQCEDYVRTTTKNDWIERTWDDPEVIQIMNFVTQVLPEKSVREYVLFLFASFCNGVPEEKFHIFIGSGGNGKSKLIDLMQYAMGGYYETLPVKVITGDRPQSNQASPEIARLKGARFVSVSEPSTNECLQPGRLKELTGGDTIYARSLHKEPIDFKPQFNIVMPTNVLPPVPADDNGVWRRVKVLHFNSRFLENPDPNDPRQYKIDTTLNQRLPEWGGAFFWILMQYYKKLFTEMDGKIPEPKAVTEATQSYREMNDHVAQFKREKLECNKNDMSTNFLALNDLYPAYVNWSKTQGFPVDDRATLRDYFIKNHCDMQKVDDNVDGWYGMKIK